jgi:hypothetical protein
MAAVAVGGGLTEWAERLALHRADRLTAAGPVPGRLRDELDTRARSPRSWRTPRYTGRQVWNRQRTDTERTLARPGLDLPCRKSEYPRAVARAALDGLTQDAMVGRRQHAGKPGSSRMCATPPPTCRSTCHSSRGARYAKHATYRWLAIDVSRRQAAPRESAHGPSSAAKPRSRDFEARVIALQARGDHGR